MALARELVGNLAGRHVLVLGSGEMARIVVRSLVASGCSVVVCNRTLEHAQELAAAFGARTVRFDELKQALQDADILVTSTSAPHVVVEAPLVQEVVSGRTRPLLILDIAVPRDVDPAVRTIPGVHLADIDDLEAISRRVLEERRGEAARAEAIVAEEVAKFEAWIRTLRVVPLIRALRGQAEKIFEEEWAHLELRLRHLPEADRRAVRAALRSVLHRLLHGPIAQLKELAVDDASLRLDVRR